MRIEYRNNPRAADLGWRKNCTRIQPFVFICVRSKPNTRSISRPIELKHVRSGWSAGNIMSIRGMGMERWGFCRAARNIGTGQALLDADDTWAMAVHSWPLINHIISSSESVRRTFQYYFAYRVTHEYFAQCTRIQGGAWNLLFRRVSFSEAAWNVICSRLLSFRSFFYPKTITLSNLLFL